MEIKYLYGHMWAVKEGESDQRANWTLEDMVFLTRKTDTFQHADMRKLAGMSPLWGGFAKRFRKADDIHFYGESVSCQVETPDDEKGMAQLKAAYVEGVYWKMEATQNRTVYTIFAIIPEGFYPSEGWLGCKWVRTTHAEMREIIDTEAKAACGW